MHKKLAADLTSLAHSILQLKNKEDVLILKEKAYKIYETLTVLAYVDEYIATTPNTSVTKEELLTKIKTVEAQQEVLTPYLAKKTKEDKATDIIEQPFDEMQELFGVSDNNKEEVLTPFSSNEQDSKISKLTSEITKAEIPQIEQSLTTEEPLKELAEEITDNKEDTNSSSVVLPTLEEELQDTISVDETIDLFTKAPASIDKTIQIGLNDRITFVKKLFEGNQADFNRVISQLNTFNNFKEAKKFINKTVKPDYNWTAQKDHEVHFLKLIEQRFE